MASAQSGVATIFGMPGFGVSGTDFTWTGIGTLFPQNFEFSDEFDVKMISDADNEPYTLIASGRVYRAMLRFVPRAGGTNTVANAKTSLPPPAPLARVTLANFPWTDANSATWAYVGGWRLVTVFDQVATYELSILKSPNRDLSVPVT